MGPSATFAHRNQVIISVVYAAILARVVYHALLMIRVGGDNWAQGDWLINSFAGPVRRSITGDLLIRLSDATNIGLLPLLVTLQACLSIFVLFALLVSVVRLRAPDSVTLIVTMPTFLLFWFYEPGTLFRKELLVLAAFSLVLLCPRSRAALWLSCGLCILAVAAHEALVVMLPGFTAVVWLASDQRPRLRSVVIASALAGAALMTGLSMTKLSTTNVAGICAPLLERGLSELICRGAIGYLDKSSSYALDHVARSIQFWPVLVIAAGIALSVTILFAFWPFNRRRWTIVLILAAYATIAPIYVVAIDWGRWVQLGTATVVFAILVAAQYRPLVRRDVANWLFWPVLITNGFWGLRTVISADFKGALPTAASEVFQRFVY